MKKTVFVKLLWSIKAFITVFSLMINFVFLFYLAITDKLTNEIAIASFGFAGTVITAYNIVNVWQDRIYKGKENED